MNILASEERDALRPKSLLGDTYQLFERIIAGVPPQNPVDRKIADLSGLGIKLTYPDASLAVRPACDRQIEIEEARPKPRSPMTVTPTMRSWNQFSAFIEEWDELRMAA